MKKLILFLDPGPGIKFLSFFVTKTRYFSFSFFTHDPSHSQTATISCATAVKMLPSPSHRNSPVYKMYVQRETAITLSTQPTHITQQKLNRLPTY